MRTTDAAKFIGANRRAPIDISKTLDPRITRRRFQMDSGNGYNEFYHRKRKFISSSKFFNKL